jgi:sucrose-6-phosphate hydrolase SacC (GH32 family)
LYYRAGVGVWWEGLVGHEAVGLATCPLTQFDGKTWQDYPFNPIFTHGAPGDFDGVGPIDPIVIEHEGTFYLFYEGVANPSDGDLFPSGVWPRAPHWVKKPGLATSKDGVNFYRAQTTPIIDDPRTLVLTAVTVYQGLWQALGLRELLGGLPYDQRRYAYYYYTSPDAIHWTLVQDEPVLRPEPDSRSLSGGRWLYEDGWYYLIYGGTPMRDYPDHFGLARSRDLMTWERYPQPVFQRGEASQWDDGGIWVGDIARIGNTYYLWYEGRSAGRSRSEEYAPGGYSQMGLATLDAARFSQIKAGFGG